MYFIRLFHYCVHCSIVGSARSGCGGRERAVTVCLRCHRPPGPSPARLAKAAAAAVMCGGGVRRRCGGTGRQTPLIRAGGRFDRRGAGGWVGRREGGRVDRRGAGGLVGRRAATYTGSRWADRA